MARQPKEIKKSKVVYLPPVYDSKRFREGVLAILDCIESLEKKKEMNLIDKKES